MNTSIQEILQKIDDLRTEVLEIKENTNDQTYYTDDCVEQVNYDLNTDTYTIRAVNGYNTEVDILATMENNGNGFTCKFPSYICTAADNYICLDYAEADYLYKMLKEYRKERGEQL